MRSLRFSGVRVVGLIAGGLILLALPASASAVSAASTFNADAEGWRLSNRSICAPGTDAPIYSLSGGNPGGRIAGIDAEVPSSPPNDQCFWTADGPAAYTGQMRANYGGTLRYDLRHPAGADFGGGIAIFDAAGNSIQAGVGATAPPVAGAWTTYQFTILETAPDWVYVGPGGSPEPATRAHFFAILSGVTRIALLGDLSANSQGDQTDIDNVQLAEAPVPLDTDGDGVTNAADNCPLVAGSAANSGCAAVAVAPPDADGDGVTDASDACPTQAGPAASNGCPPAAGVISAACETAKKKLAKAKKTLKLLQRSDASAQAIKKAKKKVKKAKAAVKKACA